MPCEIRVGRIRKGCEPNPLFEPALGSILKCRVVHHYADQSDNSNVAARAIAPAFMEIATTVTTEMSKIGLLADRIAGTPSRIIVIVAVGKSFSDLVVSIFIQQIAWHL